MPYKSEWVKKDVALEYKGVTVYHSYKDDDYTQQLEYWYSLDDNDCDDESSFDVRSIKMSLKGTSAIEILKQAIDEGILESDMSIEEIEKASY